MLFGEIDGATQTQGSSVAISNTLGTCTAVCSVASDGRLYSDGSSLF